MRLFAARAVTSFAMWACPEWMDASPNKLVQMWRKAMYKLWCFGGYLEAGVE